MKKLIISLIIIGSLFLAGCPSKANLVSMQKRSRQIATAANEGVNITRALFRENILSLSQKDKIADGFILLAEGGEFADKTLADAIANYGGNVPNDVKANIIAVFKSNIINRFLDVLERLKIAHVSASFRASIEGIRTAVLVIAGLLNIRAETEKAIIQAEAK